MTEDGGFDALSFAVAGMVRGRNEVGLRFKAEATSCDELDSERPLHNPFGSLRLVSIKDIAELN